MIVFMNEPKVKSVSKSHFQMHHESIRNKKYYFFKWLSVLTLKVFIEYFFLNSSRRVFRICYLYYLFIKLTKHSISDFRLGTLNYFRLGTLNYFRLWTLNYFRLGTLNFTLFHQESLQQLKNAESYMYTTKRDISEVFILYQE